VHRAQITDRIDVESIPRVTGHRRYLNESANAGDYFIADA
jgi:hypothetical protein